ncbi:MAG: hypothetical protein GY796_35265 [Chloroflexi bacterium]|nr:hypothetical protein [Chloroflexota bacterium]
MTVDNEKKKDAKAKRPSKKSKKSGRKQKRPKREMSMEERVTADFAACGRCSYFWVGYRVIVGEDGIETAVKNIEDGWLNMPWRFGMGDLVHKSFGARLDTTYFHYEGCCKECCRPYIFHVDEMEETAEVVVESTPEETETQAAATDQDVSEDAVPEPIDSQLDASLRIELARR